MNNTLTNGTILRPICQISWPMLLIMILNFLVGSPTFMSSPYTNLTMIDKSVHIISSKKLILLTEHGNFIIIQSLNII